MLSEEAVSMTRGSNQAVITLVPDPKGLQIDDILEEGEELLYVEDFQDNDEDFPEIKGVWSIVEDPDDPGNMVIDFNQKGEEESAGFDTTIEMDVTDFIASFRMRYIDIDYTNYNFSAFYFRDYAFDTFLSENGQVVQLLDFNQGGEWFTPVVTNRTVQDGVWYSYLIKVNGPQIDMYINDAQIGRYLEANSLPTKRENVNYLSFANASGTHVQFDDIVIELANK